MNAFPFAAKRILDILDLFKRRQKACFEMKSELGATGKRFLRFLLQELVQVILMVVAASSQLGFK